MMARTLYTIGHSSRTARELIELLRAHGVGKASRNQVGRLAVLKDSRLVGYLSLKDITHILALRGLPDGVRSAPGAVTSEPGRRAA